MTAAAQPSSPSLSNPSGRWLFGPASDLLLGCGVLYVLIIAAYAALGSDLHDGQPTTLLRLLVILVSMPHYGGTLLRVYEERSERRSYALFSIGATVVVFGAFLVSLYNFYFASLMLTLYLTWSPWHYTGQNYGIAMMFARRRGLEVTPRAKRLLYASFVLSFLLTALVMHGIIAANFTPFDYTGGEVLFLPLGLPNAFTGIAIPAVAVLYLGCLGAASALLLQSARARDLVPIWALS
ncbi:MAG: hypothetical protein VX246_16655, partial [Myxococcota bacterium]|nr:hypothetical protein [Myxococcota bacterium]